MFDYETVNKKLFDPIMPGSDYLSELATAYETISDPQLRAMAGFQLLVAAAIQAKGDGNQPELRESKILEPDAYLEDPVVRKYILDDYCRLSDDWKSYVKNLRFHAVGTTSLIFVSYNSNFALKIIQPRFRNAPTITTATKAYREQFKNAGKFAPKIYDSEDLWILMEFIPGDTLTLFTREYLHGPPKNTQAPANRIDTISAIFNKLCDALTDCSAHNIHHLDLSPDNVIVQHSDGTVQSIRLIDFGVNFLLKAHIGSGEKLSRAECFIAPELEAGMPKSPEMADIYSLGMIILEMVADRKIESDQLNDTLDHVWASDDSLGALIEDMIDRDAADRLIGFDRHSVFDSAKVALNEAVKLIKLSKQPSRPLYRILGEFINGILPFDSFEELRRRWKEAAALRSSHFKFLFHWSIVVQSACLLAIAAFFWTVVAVPVARLCDIGNHCVLPVNVPPLPISPTLAANRIALLPGRWLAFSFSIVLSRYYANIFATLSPSRIRMAEIRTLAVLTGFVMRAFPIFCIITAYFAIVFDPKAWAYWSAFGMIGIASNNFLSYRMAVRTNTLVQQKGLYMRPSTYLKDEVTKFGSWWSMVTVYGFCLWALGFLLVHGYAKDEWLYALLASICLNLILMLRQHCTKRAPGIRTMLRRIIWRLERLQAKCSTVSSARAASA